MILHNLLIEKDIIDIFKVSTISFFNALIGKVEPDTEKAVEEAKENGFQSLNR